MTENQFTDNNIKHSINLLKVFAIFLIINSHSDSFFPEKIRVLATGGALGNALFFIISGYLTKVAGNRSFVSIRMRFIRLYLPVYIVLLFCGIMNVGNLGVIEDVGSAARLLLWPTPYWFVSASFVSFILLRICEKYCFESERQFLTFSIVMVCVFVICYIFGVSNKEVWAVEDCKMFNLNIHFKCIYCFYIYCLGYYLKKHTLNIRRSVAFSMAFFGLLMTYGLKFAMQLNMISMKFQIFDQVFIIFFSIGMLYVSVSYEKQIRKWNMNLVNLIDKLSSVSLEAYIVQIPLIPVLVRVVAGQFPVNYIISVVIIIIVSYGLYIIDTNIFKLIKRML